MSDVTAQSNDWPRALPGLHSLGRLVRRAWAAYWRWQTRRATARLLHSLDDRVLSDLGISRDEIHSHVDGGRLIGHRWDRQ